MSKEPVQCWKSSDGVVHDTLGDARHREDQIDAVNLIARHLDKTDLVDSKHLTELAWFLVNSDAGKSIAKLVVELANDEG